MSGVATIAGSKSLPAGYDHPHASEQARRIAEAGLILRVQVGSGVHGTALGGYDDRDEMGLCLEPARFVTGLARVPASTQGDRMVPLMPGLSGAHTNRPELVARHGYDTKFAMHALRLGYQGLELLTTGRITLPVPEPQRGYLRSIRRGEVALGEVIEAIRDAEEDLVRLGASPSLPEQPDRAWVDDWLHRSHLAYWAGGSGA